MYPQSMFLEKIIKKFQLRIVNFTAVKKCSILHVRVFVMTWNYNRTIALDLNGQ